METVPLTTQLLAVGPAASEIAIKQLGTNGGGFFNVNSAHPFENPTPLSNFLEMLAILLIPALLIWQNSSADWKGIYALVWVAAFVSGPFTLGQLKLLPFAVQISVPVLAVSAVWISRLLNRQENATP